MNQWDIKSGNHFNYGVVVLEVVCGKRPIDSEGHKVMNLANWVMFLLLGLSRMSTMKIANNEVAPIVVPKVKPSLTFSTDMPLTIDEIDS